MTKSFYFNCYTLGGQIYKHSDVLSEIDIPCYTEHRATVSKTNKQHQEATFVVTKQWIGISMERDPNALTNPARISVSPGLNTCIIAGRGTRK